MGELDKAIADYSRAIARDRNYALAYFNRGYAYYAKGDHAKAIADFDRAATINPDYAGAYSNLTRSLSRRAPGGGKSAITAPISV